MLGFFSRLLSRIVSKRVRDLECDIAALHDLVADGVFKEYACFELWRNVAIGILKADGVWKRLRNERM